MDIAKLFFSILICQIVGFLGSFFTMPKISTWYSSLKKSRLNPPSYVFGPVWTTLYFLMGLSLYMVLKMDFKITYFAVEIFALNLALNILWSAIFFGLEKPSMAFLEIIFLWISILWTMFEFSKIYMLAAWLLVPYLLWVSFAAYLNFSVWRLNE